MDFDRFGGRLPEEYVPLLICLWCKKPVWYSPWTDQNGNVFCCEYCLKKMFAS